MSEDCIFENLLQTYILTFISTHTDISDLFLGYRLYKFCHLAAGVPS